MSDSDSLSGPAVIAINTLRDHPHLNTPKAIEHGPYGIEQINTAQYQAGLEEAAACDPPRVVNNGGTWALLKTE